MNVYCNSNKINYKGYNIYSDIKFNINGDFLAQSDLLRYIYQEYNLYGCFCGDDVFCYNDTMHLALNSNIVIDVKSMLLSDILRSLDVANVRFSTNINNQCSIKFNGTVMEFLHQLHDSDIHFVIDGSNIFLSKCYHTKEYDISFVSSVSDFAKQLDILCKSIDKNCILIVSNNVLSVFGSCKMHEQLRTTIDVFRSKGTEQIDFYVSVFQVRSSKGYDFSKLNLTNVVLSLFNGIGFNDFVKAVVEFFNNSYNVKCSIRNVTYCSIMNGQSVEIKTGIMPKMNIVDKRTELVDDNSSTLKVSGNKLNNGDVMLNVENYSKDIATGDRSSYASCNTKVVITPERPSVIFYKSEKRNLSNQFLWFWKKTNKEYVLTFVVVYMEKKK